MEAVIFCGIQATGKSTFYKQHFFNTHVRVSMDLLKTRHREGLIMEACFKTSQKLVVDNTNPSRAVRARYIDIARAHGYKVIGYYFQSVITAALQRNSLRAAAEVVPDIGIRGTFNRLELPSRAEGFDELYFVSLGEDGFTVKVWKDEV